MILIVDDRKENIMSLKSILELHSFEVDTAYSGEEALRKILKAEYELIILDVQMPGMDGFEVAEAISGYSKAKDIPIIFLTAVSIDKRFITKGYKSGGIDYVTKPFDPDILLLKVKTFSRLHEQNKKLHDAQQQLNILNQQLEQKIADRTRNLVDANAELAKKNLELQQFAYIASHDLKEPLRKIQVFGNLIKDKVTPGNDKAALYVNKVIGSADRMSALINDVLAYSAIDIPKKFEKVNLNQVVDDIISDFEILIQEKGATVRKNTLPEVEMIPVQARQLLQNLIANAIKFSKPGIAPVIAIDSEVVTESLPDAGEQDYCKLIIQDNGIGFLNEYADKIFSIFQRLHSADAFEGTGIGLAIAKKIVDTHRGSISASSEPEVGSRFTILLPLTHEKQSRDTES